MPPVGVARRDDLMTVSPYEPVADMLLFDAQAPAAGVAFITADQDRLLALPVAAARGRATRRC